MGTINLEKLYHTFLFSELLNVHFLVFYFYNLGIVARNGRFLRKKNGSIQKHVANSSQTWWKYLELIQNASRTTRFTAVTKIIKTKHFLLSKNSPYFIFLSFSYLCIIKVWHSSFIYKRFASFIEFMESNFKNRNNFLTLKSSRIDIWRWR